MTRRIRLELAYDGTGFAGWQVQPGRRTVQGVLEATLGRLGGERAVRVRGAGRTDAGAHARAQVADAALASPLGDRDLLHRLACMLPDDLRPRTLDTVDDGFDARRDARSKTYVYRLDRTPHGDPFASRFALRAPQPLDEGAIRDALGRLPGRRDWRGFAASASEVADAVRELHEARLLTGPDSGAWRLVFCGEGFLTHMVRNLVGTLLDIGAGRLAPAHVERVIATRDRTLAGPTVPAHGLCLERVAYGERAAGVGGPGAA